MRFVTLQTCLSEPTKKIWMKTDPHYQRQKCRPKTAVSSKIRFMRIFAWVSWRGGFKWEWSRRKWRFSLILPAKLPNLQSFTSKATIIMLCRPLVAIQWHPNRLPWMTLNCLFALNPFRARQLMSWRFWLLDKTVWKFAELPTYCERQKCSSGKICVDSLGCSLDRGHQMSVG